MSENIFLGDGWKQILGGTERTKLRAINMQLNWAIWIVAASDRLTSKPQFSVELGKVGTEFEWSCKFESLEEAIIYAEALTR